MLELGIWNIFFNMDKFGWSDDVLKFMLNQISDPRYLVSWAEENNVLSHILVLQRLQDLEGQKVSNKDF